MEKLTAFEFVAAGIGPRLVRLRCKNEILLQMVFVDWIGIDLAPFNFLFETKQDLVIDGDGLGHPYWNEDKPVWVTSFDSTLETMRIQMVKDAAHREINRMKLSL